MDTELFWDHIDIDVYRKPQFWSLAPDNYEHDTGRYTWICFGLTRIISNQYGCIPKNSSNIIPWTWRCDISELLTPGRSQMWGKIFLNMYKTVRKCNIKEHEYQEFGTRFNEIINDLVVLAHNSRELLYHNIRIGDNLYAWDQFLKIHWIQLVLTTIQRI